MEEEKNRKQSGNKRMITTVAMTVAETHKVAEIEICGRKKSLNYFFPSIFFVKKPVCILIWKMMSISRDTEIRFYVCKKKALKILAIVTEFAVIDHDLIKHVMLYANNISYELLEQRLECVTVMINCAG